MNNNLYSSVYRNLEREFISLSNLIHIDDKQLEIYSIKIAELLIRTVVEIESISKELYFLNDGEKNNDKNLYFDTDCIQLLEERWKLSKKVIFVSSPNLYFDIDDNKILTPLKKANKRGSSSSGWLKAYQAVKHNRGENLKKGNLKNLIRALGGLYILNIYYRDEIFQLGKDGIGINFDSSLGSELFSIKLHINKAATSIDDDYIINSDYDQCIYLLKATDKTREDYHKVIKELETKISQKIEENLFQEKQKHLTDLKIPTNEDIKKYSKIKDDCVTQVAKENQLEIRQKIESLRYEGILNKQQYQKMNAQ